MAQVTKTGNEGAADPQLLSMLETVSRPVEQVQLNIEVPGVFSFPDQWKLTDEANPNMFGYSIEFLGVTLDKGKIQPRQLTEKQIKEAEEAKTKKAVKKDPKAVEEEKKLTPEEEEAERVQREQWEALTEQERFYRTCQNPYKSSILKFQKSGEERMLEGEEVGKLKETIESGAVDVVLVRKPELSEEEIAKIKKSKAKNPNPAELFRFCFKGSVNLNQLLQPGATEMIIRVKLQQQQPSPEALRFEMKECYLLINISISPSIVPLVTQITPTTQSLFVLPSKVITNSLQTLISKLKGEIVVAVKAINADYQNFVEQEKQEEISKSMKQRQQQKKVVDTAERKRRFLEEFQKNSKYKMLKARMEKIISEICIDRMKKERTRDAPRVEDVQRKLVELGVFFSEQVSAVIDTCIGKEPEGFHEDLVADYSQSKQRKTNSIRQVTSETEEEVFLRVATEYEVINNVEKSEANYQNMILMNPESEESLFKYIQFCLRGKRFEQAEILAERILGLRESDEYLELMGVLLLRRRRYKEALGIFTRLREGQNNKAVYYQICTIIYKKTGDKKSTVDTRVIAEKMYKLKIGLAVRLDEQENPYIDTRPKPPRTKPPSLLTPQQTEDFQYQIIKLFAGYNMYDMVEEFLNKVKESVKKQLYKIQIHIFNGEYSEGLKMVEELLKNDKNNVDFAILKADICYLHKMLFEAEETYLLALDLKPDEERLYRIYLRLGHTYLNRKAWEDSKAIFIKASGMKPNSSLCWFALGVSHLRLKQYPEAEEALYLANIYEPSNSAVDSYLSEIHSNLHTQTNSDYLSVSKSNFPNPHPALSSEIVW